MTVSKHKTNSIMQRPRDGSFGWAAFDRKHREKQGSISACDVDPFPSISTATSAGTTKSYQANKLAPLRPFSSVIRPPLEFPLLLGNCKGRTINVDSDAKHRESAETSGSPVKMLKDNHSWAEQNLIEDILAAVENDVHQASVLLKAMALQDGKIEETGLSARSSSAVYSYENRGNSSSENTFVESEPERAAQEVLIPGQLFSVPFEPEWEEDDIYLSHRKDAIKMMRAASQHSRAASNAFLRGDHDSAHQLSSRARGEWAVAEKLNAKAAEEILRIRNINNNIWKIDLHGLHASEAVSALRDHLLRIESQLKIRSASSDGLTKLESSITSSSSLKSLNGLEVDSKTKKKETLPQQRQTVLHVITGTGNHSRGQAALPAAVRSFLIGNGYRFDDARPGVIAVRPKFK